MNANDREQLRLSLLRFLDAAASSARGLAQSNLVQQARNEGLPGLTEDAVKAELFYLESKGLISKANKLISPENPQWKITAGGRDAYAELSE